MRELVIATRHSPLAQAQARHIQQRLQDELGLDSRILAMSTQGDKMLDRPLAAVGGKGLFLKELEQAMLDGRADLAVHSLKDVPTTLPDGLVLAAVPTRHSPLDALVAGDCASLDELPPDARLGTASLRRRAQLLAARPDLRVMPLRGNLGTRLARLDGGDFDAIVLAEAGLRRLGMDGRLSCVLPAQLCLPAAGQGALAIECRADDTTLRAALAPLHCPQTGLLCAAERDLAQALGADCQAPVAAFAQLRDGRPWLRALVADADGGRILRADSDADDCAGLVARRLLEQGAAELLRPAPA